MATKNALFYSCRAGRPDTIKSHRTRKAAMSSAGEMGQIWDSSNKRQRQVHRSAAGGWMTVEPEKGLATDLRAALLEYELIARENADVSQA